MQIFHNFFVVLQNILIKGIRFIPSYLFYISYIELSIINKTCVGTQTILSFFTFKIKTHTICICLQDFSYSIFLKKCSQNQIFLNSPIFMMISLSRTFQMKEQFLNQVIQNYTFQMEVISNLLKRKEVYYEHHQIKKAFNCNLSLYMKNFKKDQNINLLIIILVHIVQIKDCLFQLNILMNHINFELEAKNKQIRQLGQQNTRLRQLLNQRKSTEYVKIIKSDNRQLLQTKHAQLFQLNKKYQGLSSKYDTLVGQCNTLKNQNNLLKEDINQFKKDKEMNKSGETDKFNKKYTKNQQQDGSKQILEFVNIRKENQVNKNEINFLNVRIKQLTKQSKQQKLIIESFQKSTETIQTQTDLTLQELRQNEVHEKALQKNKEELLLQAQKLTAAKVLIQNQLIAIKTQKENTQKQLLQLKKEYDTLTKKQKDYQYQIQELKYQKKKTQKAKSMVLIDMHQVEMENQDLKEKFRKVQENNKQLQKNIQKLQKENQELKNKMKSIKQDKKKQSQKENQKSSQKKIENKSDQNSDKPSKIDMNIDSESIKSQNQSKKLKDSRQKEQKNNSSKISQSNKSINSLSQKQQKQKKEDSIKSEKNSVNIEKQNKIEPKQNIERQNNQEPSIFSPFLNFFKGTNAQQNL